MYMGTHSPEDEPDGGQPIRSIFLDFVFVFVLILFPFLFSRFFLYGHWSHTPKDEYDGGEGPPQHPLHDRPHHRGGPDGPVLYYERCYVMSYEAKLG
jgi:hypothetical protein